MTDFEIIRHDDVKHYCKKCNNTIYDKFLVRSFNPEIQKKSQVLMCLIRCKNCGLINMVYHSKIYKVKLLGGDELEVN
jgi:RNase P subunit RPR2